jgi:beta-fructofuranosidase
VFGYVSESLAGWEFDRVALAAADCDIPGDVWECPDLFRAGDDAVLVVSVIGETEPLPDGSPLVRWAVGTFAGGVFAPSGTGIVDAGTAFYAPQSYTAADGRRIMIGWLRTHLDPAVEGLPTRGVMSLPREVTVRDGRVHAEPAREVLGLRRGRPGAAAITGRDPVTVTLPVPAGAVEVVVDGGIPQEVTLTSPGGARSLTVPVPRGSGSGPVRVFVDAGIAEVFHAGEAGTWTDLGLPHIGAVTVTGTALAPGATLTVWCLDGDPRVDAPGGAPLTPGG